MRVPPWRPRWPSSGSREKRAAGLALDRPARRGERTYTSDGRASRSASARHGDELAPQRAARCKRKRVASARASFEQAGRVSLCCRSSPFSNSRPVRRPSRAKARYLSNRQPSVHLRERMPRRAARRDVVQALAAREGRGSRHFRRPRESAACSAKACACVIIERVRRYRGTFVRAAQPRLAQLKLICSSVEQTRATAGVRGSFETTCPPDRPRAAREGSVVGWAPAGPCGEPKTIKSDRGGAEPTL